MARALVFSDLHLHSHKQNYNRLQDCLQVLNWVFEETVKNDCSHVFFLGDLFHERSKIDILNYLRAFEKFLDFSLKYPKIDVYLLVGNHDMYLKERWDVNSVKPFTAIPNVHIMEKPQTIRVEGFPVDFLPHTENPIKELALLKEGRKKDDLRLLLGHLAVHGATLNTLYGTKADVIVEYDDHMMSVSPEVFDDWDMTLLGHYHGAQIMNDKVEYIGSPLQLSFGEAFQDKHIMVLEFPSLEKHYIENTFSPKHYILPVSQLGDYDLAKNFVRVVVDDMSNKELIDVKKQVEKQKAATIDFKSLDKRKEDVAKEIEDAKAILYKSDEMLESYLKTVGIPAGLDEQRLLGKGRGIIAAVSSGVNG